MQSKVILGLTTLMFMAAAHAADWPSGFSKCADEGGVCQVGSASKTVSFGIKDRFVTKVLSGNVTCSTSTFGSDPYPGKAKKCAVGSAAASSSSSRPTSSSSSSRSSTGTVGGAGQTFDSTYVVKANTTFNGGGHKFGIKGTQGCEDSNSPKPVFNVEEGGKVKDVVIMGGLPAGDGIHCKGNCTLENVVWEDVCEDAATMEGGPGTVMNVIGGSAAHASDKVFQQNGKGNTIRIRNFQTYGDIGRLWMSCGNCKDNDGPRYLDLDGVTVNGRIWEAAKKEKSYAFRLNYNYGDKATIRNLRIKNYAPGKPGICVEAEGNRGGSTTNRGEQWETRWCDVRRSDVTRF